MAAFDCEGGVDFVRRVVAMLLLSSSFALALGQQNAQQSLVLRGRVVDMTGAVVPGAEVVLLQNNLVVAQVQTDRTGQFILAGVPREYRVKVVVQGFKTLMTPPVPFRAGKTEVFTLAADPLGGGYQGPGPISPPFPLQENVPAGLLTEVPLQRRDNPPRMTLLSMSRPVTVPAQPQVESQQAMLHGVVVDPTGATIPGAAVIVRSAGKVIARETTDGDGKFAFSGAPHEYVVEVRMTGFSTLTSTPVPFGAESTTSFTLQLGYSGPSVAVEPARPAPPFNETPARGILHEEPAAAVTGTQPWEYGVLAQGGVGTSDRSGYKFFLLGGHAGKILTPNLGSGLLQGNFEYAVEVFPFWQSYTPRFQKVSCPAPVPNPDASICSQPYTVGGTYTGVSITPIILRWNLTHGQRWMPWVQGAGGVIWTNHKYPAIGNTNPLDTASNGPAGDTSVWNFTPQFGIGTHYFLKPRRSLDFSANAVHISSASLGDKNPGVNASVQFSVGYTWWK